MVITKQELFQVKSVRRGTLLVNLLLAGCKPLLLSDYYQ